MAKLVLPDVSNILGNPTSAANRLNSNNDLIEAALENTLSRNGATPNHMEADFDLNANDILNAGAVYAKELWSDGQRLTPTNIVDTSHFATAEQGANADEAIKPINYTRLDTDLYIEGVREVTVGVGGDYATVGAALKELSKIASRVYKFGGYNVDIRLRPGFVWEEQVHVSRLDLSWINIKSTDPIVSIARDALITPVYGIYYPAIAASNKAGMPSIHCLFDMDKTGSGVYREGFFIVDGSWGYIAPGCGARNVGGRALHVANSSYAVARGADLRNAGHDHPDAPGGDIPGAAVRNGQSIVEIRQANLTGSTIGIKTAGGAITDGEDTDVSNCRIGIENYESVVRFGNGIGTGCEKGIFVDRLGRVAARSADFSDATFRAIECRSGHVNITGGKVRNSPTGIYCSTGKVDAYGVDASNCSSYAVIASSNADVNVETANLSGAGVNAVNASGGSKVNAQGANGTGPTVGFINTDGSIINARSATGNLGRTANTLTQHGVIFGPLA